MKFNAKYSALYGDLVDAGIITRENLPAAWASFPVTTTPDGVTHDFYDVFYTRYQAREIAGDTPATFLAFLNEVTFEVLEMLPNGIFHNLLGAAVTVESDEERRIYAAPDGTLDTSYIIGGEKITRKREYESELERAEHLLADGKPLNMWIIDRFDRCFMGVY